MDRLFTAFATRIASIVGQPAMFAVAVMSVIVWAACGPVFGFSDTWQLVINTSTTIITFLMVFVIQNSQNRDGAAMQAKLGQQASVARSQNYYLDITPPDQNKGVFVDAMAKRCGVSPDTIATIGDMSNDLAMFGKSGLSFAMGNATDEVKARATHVTDTNDNDGFAKAIERIIALD